MFGSNPGSTSVQKDDLTKPAKYAYKQREIMAGDEVGRNNVMECDANNRNNV